jgi:hypothetical protein
MNDTNEKKITSVENGTPESIRAVSGHPSLRIPPSTAGSKEAADATSEGVQIYGHRSTQAKAAPLLEDH